MVESRVAVSCPAGHAAVILNRIVRPKAGRWRPFPTRYWLVCPTLDRKLAALERAGCIAELRSIVRCDPAWAERLRSDHARHEAMLAEALNAESRDMEAALPAYFGQALARGIGGAAAPSAIKCLHAHYAFHLACGEGVVGQWLEERHGVGLCALTDPESLRGDAPPRHCG